MARTDPFPRQLTGSAGRSYEPADRPPESALDDRMRVLEVAADAGMLAPSVLGSQPWTFVLHRDRMDVRTDRRRQRPDVDPDGRELVQSVGAALFNVRVAVATRGWVPLVERRPRPDDPSLLAVVRPVPGTPETGLVRLAPALPRRRTDRRDFRHEQVPVQLVDHLIGGAAQEKVLLVPVLSDDHRHLVEGLTARAAGLLTGGAAESGQPHRWTPRPPDTPTDPSGTASAGTPAFLLLATWADDELAWLRTGEALERLILELGLAGWSVGPVSQAIEVPPVRDELRAALTGEAHPQTIVRIGHGEPVHPAPRRERSDVVVDRTGGPATGGVGAAPPASGRPSGTGRDPRSGGRGSATWS